MDHSENMRAVAALLCGCAESELLALRLYDDRLVVVYGFGQKKVFALEAVVAALQEVAVAEEVMVAEEVIVAEEVGLDTLFAERLVKVLLRAGYRSLGAVRVATDEELRNVGGIGSSTLKDIREVVGYGSDTGAI